MAQSIADLTSAVKSNSDCLAGRKKQFPLEDSDRASNAANASMQNKKRPRRYDSMASSDSENSSDGQTSNFKRTKVDRNDPRSDQQMQSVCETNNDSLSKVAEPSSKDTGKINTNNSGVRNNNF